MLIGPWALTTAGAAIVEAAPAAATFRKRRRVEVLSLVGVVMASSPFEPVLVGSAGICWLRLLRPARRFGNATLRCAPPQRGQRLPCQWRAPGRCGATVTLWAAARPGSRAQ